MIIAGGGVHYSGAVETLTDFAEQRGIPVVETVAGKATLVHDHPNYAGPIGVTGSAAANAVAEDADVVLAVGTRLQDFTTGSWSVFKNPDVRFVSHQHRPLGRPQADGAARRRRRQGLARGARRGDRRLRRSRRGGWRSPASRSPHWHGYLDSWKERPVDGKPAYAQVIQVINEICDDDDYCLSAAGGLPGELSMGWRSKSVGSFDSEYGYSTMGYEIAGAWGAKMARGDGDVIAWVGDGSYLMMNSDVYSTVMTGHKVIFMVCDNGGFAVINRLQVNTGGAEFNNLLRTARHERYFHVDFVKHLEAMGAIAEKVERARGSARRRGRGPRRQTAATSS